MAEEIRKKRRIESEGGGVEKDSEKTPAEEVEEINVVVADLEQDDMLDWLHLDDESLSELSELLDSSSEASSMQQFNFKVKFIDNPYIAPVILPSSSAYVTINGNEESCGSSFSDSESSVMASIDRCSLRSTVSEYYGVWNGGAWVSDGRKARGMGEVIDDLERFLVRGIDGWDLLESGVENVGDDDVWEKFAAEDLLGGSSKIA